MVNDFEEVKILNEAGDLGDLLWCEIIKWPEFAKETIGKQLVRSVDSIAANIAEAYGRYHYGEKIQFLYYARGSLFESKNWINRAANRALFSQEKHEEYAQSLTNIARQLNGFIRFLQKRKQRKKVKSLREPPEPYHIKQEFDSLFLFSESDLNWLSDVYTQDSL